MGLNIGEGALAPGPTDCENLGMLIGGLSFSTIGSFVALKFENAGVVGVGGNVSEEFVDVRFWALCIGKKMPAPGTEVVK